VPAALFGETRVSARFIEQTDLVTDAQRQQLLAKIALASEAVSPFWPMRTFIHHNPLHGFEHLPFDTAIRKAQDLLGGRGYLTNDEYRRLFADGHISSDDLTRAIERLGPGGGGCNEVIAGRRRISPLEVYAAHLAFGIDALEPAAFRARVRNDQALRRFCPDLPSPLRARLLAHVAGRTAEADGLPGEFPGTNEAESVVASALWSAVLGALEMTGTDVTGLDAPAETDAEERVKREVLEAVADETLAAKVAVVSAGFEWLAGDLRRIGEGMTAGDWCGRLAGVDFVGPLNREMIKWCAVFLDQGLAMWPTPGREKGFYAAWRDLAPRDFAGRFLGIKEFRRLVERLPDRPDDALIDSLRALGIPEERWTGYLERQLAQLPGYAGFVKWRSESHDYRWQQKYPIELMEYLAVRLFYERHLVDACCRETWGVAGALSALEAYFRGRPAEYFARRSSADAPVPGFAIPYRPAKGRGSGPAEGWALFARILFHARDHAARDPWAALGRDAWRLFRLAQFLALPPAEVRAMSAQDARALLEMLDRLPPDAHGPIWLEAHEAHYRDALLSRLAARRRSGPWVRVQPPKRPLTQSVYCIDVRSEGLRRHLEAVDDNETFGFAGFFGVPIGFRGFGKHEEAALCPVLLKPKCVIVEEPRAGAERDGERTLRRSAWHRVFHELVQRLERHVAASYVLIDLLGGIFGLALVGRTLFPAAARRLAENVHHRAVPPAATWLAMGKLSRRDAEDIVTEVERAAVREALADRRWAARIGTVSPVTIEAVRTAVLAADSEAPDAISIAACLNIPLAEAEALAAELRSAHGLDPVSRAARIERLGAQGFTKDERAFYIETGLRGMGLTGPFARLVLICGHGSTSLNNPYAAALDCGACGGNRGGPSARAFTMMANEPVVRAMLRERGLDIPDDTWFIAGDHNTTTDRVAVQDAADCPETHKDDLRRLRRDLEEAGARLARERCGRLPGSPSRPTPRAALRHVERRSADIAQVRPEWGLSSNAAFVIAHRSLTRGLDLGGRVFLHSYDWRRDSRGTVLEVIMTAPLIVAEWINMEHYFSTVDNRIYGSDSKVIHNVVGGFGVMLGSGGDIQTGLPHQTVMAGEGRYHDPLRLLAVIEAPHDRIASIIERHHVLQHLFDNGWVNLVALDPRTDSFLHYRFGAVWEPLAVDPAGARAAS
jgi:uncharacterized protein